MMRVIKVEVDEEDEKGEVMSDNQNYELIRVSASLVLSGKNLDPQEVTTKLGIMPSESFSRGDYRTDTEKWSRGFWKLSSEKIGEEEMRAHIEWLVDQLFPIKHQLQEQLKDPTIRAWISCYWLLPTDHEVISLSSSLLAKIAEIGLDIDVDLVVDAHILN